MRTDAATVQPTIQNVFAARQERAAHRMPATLEVRRQLDRPRTPSFLRQPQEPHRLLAERLAVHGQPFRPHTAIEVSQDRQVVARSVGHVAEAQDICPGRQGLGPPVDLLGRHACGTAVTAAGGRGLLGIEPGKAQRRRIGVGKDHPGTGSNCGRPRQPQSAPQVEHVQPCQVLPAAQPRPSIAARRRVLRLSKLPAHLPAWPARRRGRARPRTGCRGPSAV